MKKVRFEGLEDEENECRELVSGHDKANRLHHRRLSRRSMSSFPWLTILSVSIMGAFSFLGKSYPAVLTKSANATVTRDHGTSFPDPIATTQIENFRNGDGILFNLHITHHGGTSVCWELQQHLATPSFACSGAKKDGVGDDYPSEMPWTHEDTAKNIAIVHKYFQFISKEFMHPQAASQVRTVGTL